MSETRVSFVATEAVIWALNQTTETPLQRLTLVVIAAHADEHGGAWPAIERLCQLCCVTRRATRRAITELANMGLLIVPSRVGGVPGSSTLYRLRGYRPTQKPQPAVVDTPNAVTPDTGDSNDRRGDSNDTGGGTQTTRGTQTTGDSNDREGGLVTLDCVHLSPPNRQEGRLQENRQGGDEVNHLCARDRVPAREDLSPPAASPPPPVVGEEQPAGAPRSFAMAPEMVRIWNAAVSDSPVLAVQRLTTSRAAMLEAAIMTPLFGGDLAKWKIYCRLIAQDPRMRGERSTTGWHGGIDDAVTDTRTLERIAAQMQPKRDPMLEPWLKIFPDWMNREPEWVYPDPLQVRQETGRGGALWQEAEKDARVMGALSSVYEACAYAAPSPLGSDPRPPGGQNSGYSDDVETLVDTPPAGAMRRSSVR